jgi:hypothetical protein
MRANGVRSLDVCCGTVPATQRLPLDRTKCIAFSVLD